MAKWPSTPAFSEAPRSRGGGGGGGGGGQGGGRKEILWHEAQPSALT